MNKSQLAEAVAREARLSKIDAVKALNAFVKVAVEALRGDEKILLTGLGTFSTVRYPERMGRNPRTGAPVRIPARRAVRFRLVAHDRRLNGRNDRSAEKNVSLPHIRSVEDVTRRKPLAMPQISLRACEMPSRRFENSFRWPRPPRPAA